MQPNPFLVDRIWTPQVRSFYRSQFQEMLLMDRAHGMMLVKQGLLDREDYRTIAAGLDRVERSLKEEDLDGELGDLYFNITRKLYDFVGERTGCLLHVGRSRNDMVCACCRMQARGALLGLMDRMNGLMELLLKLAEEHVGTVITYYTYGQPSQPGTFGHYLMLVFQLLSRDYVRLQAAYRNANRSPMGAAAGIGTSFPLDPAYTARLLGFDGVIEHSLDAISSPDYLLEAEAAVTILMSGMSRLAQDLFSWASYESQLLDCDDSIASGSSIMPQKKNPECFEHMRAQSARAVGMFADAMALARNTTLFPNVESTVDLFYDFGPWMEEAEKVLGLLEAGLQNSRVRRERSYEYTRDNFTAASTMAETLAQRTGVPFTETHHVIAGMVRRLMEADDLRADALTGKLLEEVSEQVLGRPIVMTDEEVRRMADPLLCLEGKVTGGTPKPEDLRALLRKGRETLEEQVQWLGRSRRQIEEAYEQLRRGL